MVFNHGALIFGQKPKSKPRRLKNKSSKRKIENKIDINDIPEEKKLEPEVVVVDETPKEELKESNLFSFKDEQSFEDVIVSIKEVSSEFNKTYIDIDPVEDEDILTEEELIEEIKEKEKPKKKKRKYSRRKKKSTVTSEQV